MNGLLSLQQDAERALGLARELALLRAFAASHGVGVDQIPVPTDKTRDVTGDDKPVVWAARDAVTELVWLHHARDAVCVRTGLTPDQVAGVLSERTRVANGNGRKAETPRVVGWEPLFWPAAIAARDGADGAVPPPMGKVERQPDEADREFVLAARRATAGTDDEEAWDTFRRAYGARRRLTTQQIAAIVAVARRTGALDS